MAGKEKKKIGEVSIDDVRDYFHDNPELNLNDLDTLLMVKLIASALDSCISDDMGNPPSLVISSDFILLEIKNKRFSIAIRDNNLYS